MKNKRNYLYPCGFYHVYNRANGDEVLFRQDINYQYFLKKYSEYINPVARTCAYCLMPNHFHFIIQIRPYSELIFNLGQEEIMKKLMETSHQSADQKLSLILSKQFSRMLNSYAQAYNKMYERKGSLFMRNYKRIKIDTDAYFRDLVIYIHLNPIKANLTSELEAWKYCSYNVFLNGYSNLIQTDLTIDFFNDLNNFIFVHQNTLQGL